MKKAAVFGIARQMLSFGFLGVIGFLVDVRVLYVALFCGLGLYAGRAVPYLAALTATWRLNRRYTFEQASAYTSYFG